MDFPLPLGHVYGVNPHSLQCHDGRGSLRERRALEEWQRAYSLRVRDIPVTGVFDGPTQQAVFELQRTRGLPVTGYLDERTWRLITEHEFESEPEISVDVQVSLVGATETAESAPGVVGDTPDPFRRAEKPSRSPRPPKWFDPNVPEASRDHVVSVLGLPPDIGDEDLAACIRGVQLRAKLPTTGVMDTPTARALDRQVRRGKLSGGQ